MGRSGSDHPRRCTVVELLAGSVVFTVAKRAPGVTFEVVSHDLIDAGGLEDRAVAGTAVGRFRRCDVVSNGMRTRAENNETVFAE